jgi:hypothetical protein
MPNPDLERFVADRTGAASVEVRSSHASPASHPYQVARLVLAAAPVGARARQAGGPSQLGHNPQGGRNEYE